MHILAPVTDKCSSWIRGRGRMAVESFHDKVSTKECAGRGDRTRGRLHAKRTRFRSSYRAWCSQWNCQMIFGIGRGFAEVQILKKWNWPYPLNLLVYFDKILHSHYYWHDLDRGIAKSSPRDCKMTFNIGRGYADLQILKKWKWPKWVDYCDETLHTHWY